MAAWLGILVMVCLNQKIYIYQVLLVACRTTKTINHHIHTFTHILTAQQVVSLNLLFNGCAKLFLSMSLIIMHVLVLFTVFIIVFSTFFYIFIWFATPLHQIFFFLLFFITLLCFIMLLK